MNLPSQISEFIKGRIEMSNMTLPWNYPNIDKFNDFQAGYRFNANTLENLTGQDGGFHENWFVVCSNYFADPFFIDISEAEINFPIYYAQHGAGKWNPIKVSNSIIEFGSTLKQLKDLESNSEAFLEYLRKTSNLESELWEEVYQSTIEEQEDDGE